MDEDKKEKNEVEKKEESESEKKESRKTPEDIEKEMQQMLEDLSEQMGVDKSQIRVVSVNNTKRSFKVILFEALYYIIANCLLLLGLSGYIKWCDAKWYELIFFSLMFSGIEILLRNLIYIAFKKTIIQSFGLIFVLAPLVAIVVCIFIPFIVNVDYIVRYLIVCVILLIVREFIKKYSVDFYRRHLAKKKKK